MRLKTLPLVLGAVLLAAGGAYATMKANKAASQLVWIYADESNPTSCMSYEIMWNPCGLSLTMDCIRSIQLGPQVVQRVIYSQSDCTLPYQVQLVP